MSRIEEALKRAAGSRGAAVLRDVPALSPVETAPLSSYPREARSELREALPPPIVRAAAVSRVDFVPKPTVNKGESRLILIGRDPVAVEQYRRLAGTLHGLQVEHETKTLMVTSALPRDGKTLTVTNLALTLSGSYGRRVLLIDADLRRPSVHELLGVPNTGGLSEALKHESGELPLVQCSHNLWVLPAGRPNSDPMAGLTSDRMRVLLEEAAAKFDWVLLDTPPVGIMPDANLLARLTHGVIFVVAAGTTPFALVDRAVTEIGREQIVGTVLNRVADGSNPATGYYQQYYGGDRS
ncbi:MAG: CpsD/CapB family tyrosine-protein kinase [Vicinamibacterales bacterium]